MLVLVVGPYLMSFDLEESRSCGKAYREDEIDVAVIR